MEKFLIIKKDFFTEDILYAEDVVYCNDLGDVLFFDSEEECELYLEINNLKGTIAKIYVH
jgi:hypothetical protein